MIYHIFPENKYMTSMKYIIKLLSKYTHSLKKYNLYFLLLLWTLTNIGCSQDKTNENNKIKKSKPQVNKQIPDSILKSELELIGVEDQTLRFILPDVTEKFSRESSEYKYFWSLIHRQDSICIEKLINILDTYGWLGKSRVGTNANQAIWLVMQHADVKIQEKYLPFLKESVEKGESEGWHLAFLEDRILMYNEKEQIYGTQAIWDNNLKKNKIYPIQDVKNVNKRRKKLGLKPIEEHAKNNGYILDQKNK